MIIPVILCGGIGSRLWPLSRKTNPKQFISITSGGETLFDQTLDRVRGKLFDAPIIVCNQAYEFKIREALEKKKISPKVVILEPEGRNTAPAIALAALYAKHNHLQGNLMILPADHYIASPERLVDAVSLCDNQAADNLITFGIVPSSASTAYGYIKKGAQIQKNPIYKVNQFVEKPDVNTACKYVASEEYYWNSGIFLFNPDLYLRELQNYAESIYKNSLKAFEKASYPNHAVCKVDEKSFLLSEDISVDYAVLEKSSNILVCPVAINWSDVGSWDSIYKVGEKDEKNNLFIGDVVEINSKGNFVYSSDKLTALVDVENLVVISTKDAVLVADKSASENVKNIVEQLKSSKRKEYSEHLKIYRPWGYYEDIDQGKNFRVKRISVNPGAKLSLQSHRHRSEHWVVVEGTADVCIGGVRKTLKQGESTFVPIKTKHRLENNTQKPLKIIETQIGDYLGEDDIVRYEDIYGRS